MPDTQTVSASEFKAKCLDIFDRLAERSLQRVVITKRGRVVAVVTPPERDEEAVRQLYGFMRGSVVLPADLDLTEPFLDEPCMAEEGELHG